MRGTAKHTALEPLRPISFALEQWDDTSKMCFVGRCVIM